MTTFALTEEQLKKFDTDGYLIIPNFITSEECDRLRTQANALIDNLDLSKHPRTIFKTSTNSSQTTTAVKSNDMGMASSSSSMAPIIAQDTAQPDYFLDSADKISYFFEDGAFNSDGKLSVDIHRAINKIGHALHVLDPVYSQFSSQPAIKKIATQLGYVQPIVLQSMIIFKQPRIGGVVSVHRDSTFLYTEPKSAKGLWFALEDCTEQNGCLKFVPGSHKDGKCTRRFVRQNKSTSSTNMNVGVTTGFIGEESASYDEKEFVSAPVSKGSLVLLHGDVVHMSTQNTSAVSRNIYTFHIIESYRTEYLADNWLQWDRPMPHLLSEAEEAATLEQAKKVAIS